MPCLRRLRMHPRAAVAWCHSWHPQRCPTPQRSDATPQTVLRTTETSEARSQGRTVSDTLGASLWPQCAAVRLISLSLISLASSWPILLRGRAPLLSSTCFFRSHQRRLEPPFGDHFGDGRLRLRSGLVLSLRSSPLFLLGVLPPAFRRSDFLGDTARCSTVGDADADAEVAVPRGIAVCAFPPQPA